MDRRRFLTTTMLSGAAMVGFAGSAHAFSQQNCADVPGTLVCRELLRHQELLAQLEKTLADKGLTPDQRRQILAAAICPFCGQPLIG